MELAASMSRLGTETAFEVLARARALEATGRRVVHLEIGEPDFETPPHVVEAGIQALRDGHTHYCPSPGLPVLREACAAELSRTRGLDIPARRVLVTPGAKPFLFFGVLATCDPGDEVIYPDPGFPIYESVIRWAGADAGAAADPGGGGLRVHGRAAGRAADAADEARDPQLAGQPDGRRRRPRAQRRHRPRARRPPTAGSSPTRSTPSCSTRASTTPSPPTGCSIAPSCSTASRRRSR